jgi:hypothetical protein
MPKDDINALYEKARRELQGKRPVRQETLVDITGVPPPPADTTQRPPAQVPRPTPKAAPLPLPAIELDSAPHAAPSPTPLPSTYPDSEAPTRVDGRRKKAPHQVPHSIGPLSKADEAQARATREWHPPVWLVAVAKWIAPPIMLMLMAGAYWFQAQVSLSREQADALSVVRKKKDADYAAMQTALATAEAKLGIAQAERDAARAQAERARLLCSQGALKIVKEDKP